MSQLVLFDLQCLATRISKRGDIWPTNRVNERALELDVHMQGVLERLKERAPRETYEIVKAVVESHDYLVELARDESMTTDRLREILCGPGGQADEDRDRHGDGFGNAAGRRKRRRRHRRLVGCKKRRLSG